MPYNYIHAQLLDDDNNNTVWQDVTKLEMQHMQKFKVFKASDVNGEALTFTSR